MSNKEEPMNVDIVTDVNNEKENESNKVEVEETVPTEAEYSKSFSFQKFMGKVMFDDVSSIFVQKHIGVMTNSKLEQKKNTFAGHWETIVHCMENIEKCQQ